MFRMFREANKPVLIVLKRVFAGVANDERF